MAKSIIDKAPAQLACWVWGRKEAGLKTQLTCAWSPFHFHFLCFFWTHLTQQQLNGALVHFDRFVQRGVAATFAGGGQKKCRVPSSTFRKMKKKATAKTERQSSGRRFPQFSVCKACGRHRAVLSSAFTLCSLFSLLSLHLRLEMYFLLVCAKAGNCHNEDDNYHCTGSTLNQPILYITPLMGMLSTRNRKLATYSVMYVCSPRLCLLRAWITMQSKQSQQSYRHGVQLAGAGADVAAAPRLWLLLA